MISSPLRTRLIYSSRFGAAAVDGGHGLDDGTQTTARRGSGTRKHGSDLSGGGATARYLRRRHEGRRRRKNFFCIVRSAHEPQRTLRRGSGAVVRSSREADFAVASLARSSCSPLAPPPASQSRFQRSNAHWERAGMTASSPCSARMRRWASKGHDLSVIGRGQCGSADAAIAPLLIAATAGRSSLEKKNSEPVPTPMSTDKAVASADNLPKK